MRVMGDAEIRKVLLGRLMREYGNDVDTLIIEELGLCQGDARIDLAVINGIIHGYEIKSERDTLERLPLQEKFYNKTLDKVSIIAGQKHIKKISRVVPKWWGIYEAVYEFGKLKINKVCSPQDNPNIDPNAIVQLLWKNEALEILKEIGFYKGMSNKTRTIIWNHLVSSLSIDEMKRAVRQKLKSRQHWRPVPQQK